MFNCGECKRDAMYKKMVVMENSTIRFREILDYERIHGEGNPIHYDDLRLADSISLAPQAQPTCVAHHYSWERQGLRKERKKIRGYRERNPRELKGPLRKGRGIGGKNRSSSEKGIVTWLGLEAEVQ